MLAAVEDAGPRNRLLDASRVEEKWRRNTVKAHRSITSLSSFFSDIKGERFKRTAVIGY